MRRQTGRGSRTRNNWRGGRADSTALGALAKRSSLAARSGRDPAMRRAGAMGSGWELDETSAGRSAGYGGGNRGRRRWWRAMRRRGDRDRAIGSCAAEETRKFIPQKGEEAILYEGGENL